MLFIFWKIKKTVWKLFVGVIRSVDKNVIDRIPEENVAKEPPKEEKNVVPGQVPPPASKDENRPAAGGDKLKQNEIPDQVAQPNEEGVAPGQVVKPGQGNQPGQANPPGEVAKPLGNDRHVAKIPDEDDIEEDEQVCTG